MKSTVFFILFLTSLSIANGQSGNTILERKVSLSVKNERLPDVLSQIAKAGKFSFSYNSTIIQDTQFVSLDVKNKPVKEILNEIFKGTMNYKEKSNHVILTKVPFKQTQAAPVYTIISGYVEDATTHERIADVSVYDKKSIVSAVTDESGYFRMRLEKKNEGISLAVSKENYRDTVLLIPAAGEPYLNILIHKVPIDSSLRKSEVEEDSVKEELPMPYTEEPNVRNIHDTIYNDIQISLLPFLGTNGTLSGNVINNYSINLLGGYSMGTRQIELGIFVNVDRGHVGNLQIAGFGNLVGKNVTGFQASGLFNVNGGETRAAQFTGLGNVNLGDFKGVQVAGISNVNLSVTDGVQIAGIWNIAKEKSEGVQIAGVGNQTESFSGSQIAGVTNFASKQLSGSQISGVFNYGKNVRGTQIGLFNFADSLGGVPIGLVSFVNHGYHKLEVSADEVFYANLAFRTGVRKFYNILLVGMKPEETVNQNYVWTFGYGLGMAPKITRWLHLNIDLTAQHVNNGAFTTELSLLNKAHLGLDFQLAKKFSIYGGLTLNGYLTNSGYSDYPALFTNYHPAIINDHTFDNGNNLKMWWGFKVGLRFL